MSHLCLDLLSYFSDIYLMLCVGDVLGNSAALKPPVSKANDATDILECLRQQLANGNASCVSRIPSEMMLYSVDKLNGCHGCKSLVANSEGENNLSSIVSDVDVAKMPCQVMLKDSWKSLPTESQSLISESESQSLISESEFTDKGQGSATNSYCSLVTTELCGAELLCGESHVVAASTGQLDGASGHTVTDGHHRLPVSVDTSCGHHPNTKNIHIQNPTGGNLLEAKTQCSSGQPVAMATECMQLNQLPVLVSCDTAVAFCRGAIDKDATVASDVGRSNLLQSHVVTHHVDGMVVMPGSALVGSYGLAIPVTNILDTSALSTVILDNRLLAHTDVKNHTHSQVRQLENIF